MAIIDGTSLVVGAAQVPKPQWIRFAWNETAEPNLMNEEGLPANSFMRQCDEAF
jgi:sialate O-acetylesterase